MEAPIDKQGAEFFLNQNSREPVTEPDELLPLWKILHLVGADWTYGSKGWAGENYCMFLADNDNWERLLRQSADKATELGWNFSQHGVRTHHILSPGRTGKIPR